VISSLYVHIPFCNKICDYCDFTKLQYFHNYADKYLDVLSKEIASTVKNKKLKTIYIGGGTPSSLSLDQLKRLLDMLAPYAKAVEEYSFECNPDSIDIDKIKLLKKYGINRISIGVESTDDKILASINREHTFNDVKHAISLYREIGIDNINVDLILGLPNVTLKMLEKDLENILELSPKHISAYSLTVHPNTVFYINGINEPSSSFSRAAYDLVHKKLISKGYIHYEISNFALPGYESKHNLTYWKNEQYYAVGLGASGYEDNTRYKNTINITKYLSGNVERENEIVDEKSNEEYFIMLNLRTIYGLDLKRYYLLFNKDLYAHKKNVIDDLIKHKLLTMKNDILAPTYEGMMVLDQILLKLF